MYCTDDRGIDFWRWGEGYSLVSQLLRESENIRFPNVSSVLGHEPFHIDLLPIATQHMLQRQGVPSKEIRNINRRTDFFSVVVSQQAGIGEGPLRRNQIQYG